MPYISRGLQLGILRPACIISRLLAAAVFFCYETIIIIDIDCLYLRRYLSRGHCNEQNELCVILAMKDLRGVFGFPAGTVTMTGVIWGEVRNGGL